MNSRFKFRVWDKGNEQYLNLSEVDYLTLDTENGGLIIGFLDELMTEMTYMPEKDMVVEQCTELSDKNGNLIYEGDIVKIPDDYETYGFMSGEKREVYFCDGGFRLKPKVAKLGRGHWLEQGDDLEIIGNIHEQAEQKDK